MGKCKLCGKHGLFVITNKDGYCMSCASINTMIAKRAPERERLERIKQQKKEDQWAKICSIPKYNITLSETSQKRQRGFEPPVYSNITPKGNYADVVVFDTETTGIAPSSDRIIELAAIRFTDGKPTECFHTYIDPERPIPAEATKVNKITDDMVADSPKIGRVIKSFDEFVGSSVLVAHNLEFDLKFIFYSGSHVMETKRKYIDTLGQARRIIKKDEVFDYKLESLCDLYFITNARAHSALSDAEACGELFFALVSEVQN